MKSLIITYLMTYGGAAIAPFMPFVGLCIYVCFGIIRPPKLWFWAVPEGNYSEIIAIALLVGWAFAGFGTWNLGKAKWILFLFGGFVAWSALSMQFAAIDWDTSYHMVDNLLKIFVPFVVGITLVDSTRRLRALAWTIILSVGYVAYNENLKYFEGYFLFQNDVAHEITVGIALAFFMGLYSEKVWQKWLCWILAGLMAHVPLFHMSRGAMVGLMFMAVLTLILMPKNWKSLGAFALGVIVASLLAGPSVVAEFQTIFVGQDVRDSSAQSRFDLWADLITVAKQNPILGVGPANWPLIAHEYGWIKGKQGHGLWTQLFAETGFIGGSLILGFYVVCAWHLWFLARRLKRTNNWLLGPALGVCVSIVAWVTEGQFGSFWALETPYYVVLLGAATLRVVHVEQSVTRLTSEGSRLLPELEQVPPPGFDPDILSPEVSHA